MVNTNFTTTTYSITLKNVGFAKMLKNRKVSLVFENGTNTATVNIDTDIRTWGDLVTLNGNYTVPFQPLNIYLVIEGGVRLANTDVEFLNGRNKL